MTGEAVQWASCKKYFTTLFCNVILHYLCLSREISLGFGVCNRFQTFPSKLVDLPNLELLDMSANVIESLETENPTDLSKLMAVDVNLNENFVESISPELAKSPRLRTLRLQGNQLTLNSIPEPLLSDSKVKISF